MKISILAVTLASLAAKVTASYASSCRNCRLEKWDSMPFSGLDYGHYLLCDCKQANGQWHASRLDLNRCIANSDGYMVSRAEGNLGRSCHGYGLLEGKTFTAFCKKA
ncbi:Cyanovirin-N [Chaetomium fimeti]|uniref:Cyanovirin-N n=1 Tax=Chaetomium fimeti TaxID=1854472 RepID=A0AAE0H6Q4_9PEZI|nr:Cyanovirin-N [Chaetomium fimeti]